MKPCPLSFWAWCSRAFWKSSCRSRRSPSHSPQSRAGDRPGRFVGHRFSHVRMRHHRRHEASAAQGLAAQRVRLLHAVRTDHQRRRHFQHLRGLHQQLHLRQQGLSVFRGSQSIQGPWAAYMGPLNVVLLRVGLGYLVAVITAIIVEWQFQKHGTALLHPSLAKGIAAIPTTRRRQRNTPGRKALPTSPKRRCTISSTSWLS